MISRLPHTCSPEVFWFDIPPRLSATENTLRMVVFGGGLVLCFLSWIALIAAPDSAWSMSAVGFLAPSRSRGCRGRRGRTSAL
jgi:hypothetical protein